jgi:hypothetical protein
VQNQIVYNGEKRDAIINECGIRDVWPVLAQSVTWGYGSTGTFGFGVQNVRDRFHPSGHSAFFDKNFVRDYWLPAAAGLPFDFSPTDRSDATSPRWFTFLRLPLRWAFAAGLVLLLGAGSLELVSASQNGWCGRGAVRVDAACRNAADLKSKKELAARISTLLEDTKRVLDLKGGTLFPMMRDYDGSQQAWDEIRQVATGLLQRVSDGLSHVQDYNAFIWQEGDKTILVTREERIAIDSKYWNAFKGVKGHFDGRASILKQMLSSTSPPSRNQMDDWRRELEDLHGKLEGAAVPLLQLLS